MARSAYSRFSPRFIPAVLGAGLFCLAGAGCVSQEDYTALKMSHDNALEQLAAANAAAESAQSVADSLRQQLARGELSGNVDQAMLDNLKQQIATLQAERDEWMGKYDVLTGKIGQGPALPEELTNELTQFAMANPDLIAFDAANGIVKFKSDVTFASGDAELTPEAKTVIGRFAQILNGPVASNYRLEIAGHTDNVAVSSNLTRSKGHKDNWYLSSHRAISVAQTLMAQNVDKTRIGVTGYADQRPVASNTDAAGRQLNRRVEVLILPKQVSQPQPTTPTAGTEPQPEAETAAAGEALSK